MKIHSVKYYDKNREWGYDTIHFSDLTLLVGVSGAGKTQILESLASLKSIAKGQSGNGIVWEISFSNDGADYFWSGEFKLLNGIEKRSLIKEIIQLNGKEVARKSENEIFFEGKKMPKFPPVKSLISIFKEEEDIKKALEGFEKITLKDHSSEKSMYSPHTYLIEYEEFLTIKEKHKTLEQIRESDLDMSTKLYCLYENKKSTFAKIKDRFINIFQQVEDVIINVQKVPSSQLAELFIKEKGVKRWIPQDKISSGMLRTFLHISEMYLLKKGSVILIDEFESSLGINCINALAEDLMFENNDIQFIITSHHPYIINQIPYEYWKIVTRENGKIVTYDAEEFNLGESHHERFMNLINLPTYKKGIVHA